MRLKVILRDWGSNGLAVSSWSRIPKVRGSTHPLGTLGNVSEYLFLGSTQALTRSSKSALAVRRGALAGLHGYVWLHKLREHVKSRYT